jgi:hypothetical protein
MQISAPLLRGCRYMKLVRDGNISGVDCKKPYYDACLEALVKQDLGKPD